MSRFFSSKYANLEPYVPGEQPRDQRYIKLNTNESPYAPSKAVREAAEAAAGKLQLYCDTECVALRAVLAGRLGISPEELVMTNGSDEVLLFAFMAFCDERHPAVFPDVTYGFYPVFACVSQVPYREIPLQDDLRMNLEALRTAEGTLFIANPNAPTGLALPRAEIEKLLQSMPERLVVVDEAFVDFGAESCVPLIRTYPNLLVTRTFSKSRSLAGARLGFGIGCPELIRDLNTIRFSVNPYNVNSMTQAAALACLREDEVNEERCRRIAAQRDRTARHLQELDFDVTDSRTNFLFVRHPALPGDTLYTELKKRGILIRHFSLERIRDYHRITIGTEEQMNALVRAIQEVLEERT